MPGHDVSDLNEIMRRKSYQEYYLDQMKVLPSTEVKWTIRPNQENFCCAILSTELYKHNMGAVQSKENKDIVIVSGIPPGYDFGEAEVMEIVRRFAPNAEVVPEH